MVPQESWESGEIPLLGTTLHFINVGSANQQNGKTLVGKFFSL